MNIPLGLIGPSNSGLSNEFQETQKKTVMEPEQALMLAVLEDAIFCYQKYLLAKDRRGKTLFHEAEEWIFDEESDWIFSFENICEVLGLDPHYVRKGMLDLRVRMLRHRSRGQSLSTGTQKKNQETCRSASYKTIDRAGSQKPPVRINSRQI